MFACRTAGVDQTRALGGAVATLVDAGDVVVLVGDLGAGKTAFVQGFAASLGVTAPVTSPHLHAGQPLRGPPGGESPRCLPLRALR